MNNKKRNISSACLILMILFVSSPLLGSKTFVQGANENEALMNYMHLELQGTGEQSPSGFSPTQIRTAYNLPSSGGSGTIAIVDAYDDPTAFDDLDIFSLQFSLPRPSSSNFEVHKMSSSIPENDGWAAEISLDVQWAHAIAPDAKILLVEAQDNSPSNLLSAVDYARNRNEVVAISMSWGGSEYSGETDDDFHFTSSYGAVFFAASGDYGAFQNQYPAASPNVIGVGGTSLTLNPDGSVASETGWSGSGGFRSWFEAEPNYQKAYSLVSIGDYRLVPDVSYQALDFSTYMSFDSSYSGWFNVSGTSAGTPQWAAIASIGHNVTNDRLYKIAGDQDHNGRLYASDLRDITSGDNGYDAVQRWDYVTGLGSPLTTSFNYPTAKQASDINIDDQIDIYDAIILAGHFDTQPSSYNWFNLADINNDYQIDIYDSIILASYFGQSVGTGLRATLQSLSGGASTAGGTSVYVDPSQRTVFKGEVFSVNVNVGSVTDLAGWEFKLYWNSTVLNCTNAVVQSPVEWQDYAQDFGTGLENSYNATNGRFYKAETAAYPAPTFNGSMTIAMLTFKALQTGTTSLTLMETKLGNSTGDPIEHTVSSGSGIVYYGRYMRSDTQQVNGLSAYKLDIPQSTNSAISTQSGSGAGALFGIRAWVRHSNGVEQEISLDGQTGTPEATVGGGSAGIRSSTVSVAQTALQSTDSLVVRVYVQIAEGPWNLCATFTTEQLQASTLKATTWTMYYYTSSVYNRITDRTTAKFYWGTATYNSRIQNLQYG